MTLLHFRDWVHCCCEWMFCSVMYGVDLGYCWTAGYYTMWYYILCGIFHRIWSRSHSWRWHNPLMPQRDYELTVEFVWIVFESFLETTFCLRELMSSPPRMLTVQLKVKGGTCSKLWLRLPSWPLRQTTLMDSDLKRLKFPPAPLVSNLQCLCNWSTSCLPSP